MEICLQTKISVPYAFVGARGGAFGTSRKVGFDSRWCHWIFSLTLSFRPHYGPGVDSASNKNEYQEYLLKSKGGRCVGLTTLPLSYLEIWEPQPPGNLRACPGL